MVDPIVERGLAYRTARSMSARLAIFLRLPIAGIKLATLPLEPRDQPQDEQRAQADVRDFGVKYPHQEAMI